MYCLFFERLINFALFLNIFYAPLLGLSWKTEIWRTGDLKQSVLSICPYKVIQNLNWKCIWMIECLKINFYKYAEVPTRNTNNSSLPNFRCKNLQFFSLQNFHLGVKISRLNLSKCLFVQIMLKIWPKSIRQITQSKSKTLELKSMCVISLIVLYKGMVWYLLDLHTET